jgi:hypothetical protein
MHYISQYLPSIIVALTIAGLTFMFKVIFDKFKEMKKKIDNSISLEQAKDLIEKNNAELMKSFIFHFDGLREDVSEIKDVLKSITVIKVKTDVTTAA